MKKLLLGSFLAAIVMFVWGAIFWASPFPYKFFSKTADDAVTGKALLATFPESGVYVIPGPHNDSKVVQELHKAGPLATVFIQRQGKPAMGGPVFLFGFLHELATTLMLALFLRGALPVTKTYGCRVMFVTSIGVIGGFFLSLSAPIWWSHPPAFHLLNFVYTVVAFALSGLVLAKFVKPEPEAGKSV